MSDRPRQSWTIRLSTVVLAHSVQDAIELWAEHDAAEIMFKLVDGWQTITTKFIDQPIDLAA